MANIEGQEGLLVDFDTGVLRRGRLLVQRGPGVVLFLGFGSRTRRLLRFACNEASDPDPDPFIARCQRIASSVECGWLAKAQDAGVPRSVLDIEDRTLRRLAIAEALAKAGYNADEPRDAQGRWTSEGSGAGAAAAATAGSLTEDAVSLGRGVASLFGDVGPEVLTGLAELGASFAAPAAFLGTFFIPTNSDFASDGALPGRPDITYHYDLDTGTLTLTQDGAIFYIGHVGADGVFRDQDDHAIGRALAGSLILDSAALPAPTSQAGVRSRADGDRNDPSLCPAASEENVNGRQERALAYQEQITRLPRGFDVVLPDPGSGDPVRFDGCCIANSNCLHDGDMLEAKGPGYADKMTGLDQWKTWFSGLRGMESQMGRQDGAAGADGRIAEWHFAEYGPAAFFMTYASVMKLRNTVVILTPAAMP